MTALLEGKNTRSGAQQSVVALDIIALVDVGSPAANKLLLPPQAVIEVDGI
jgi:hypothetical protein